MKNLIASLCLTLALLLGVSEVSWSDPKSKIYSANEIMVLDDSAVMNQTKDYFVTSRTGPVGKNGIPKSIKKGDKITVKDTTITVNFIQVTYILEDMSYAGQTFAKKGDVSCTLVQSPKDFPEKGDRSRIWIFVEKCKPLR